MQLINTDEDSCGGEKGRKLVDPIDQVNQKLTDFYDEYYKDRPE
jgi:hypothetical protein